MPEFARWTARPARSRTAADPCPGGSMPSPSSSSGAAARCCCRSHTRRWRPGSSSTPATSPIRGGGCSARSTSWPSWRSRRPPCRRHRPTFSNACTGGSSARQTMVSRIEPLIPLCCSGCGRRCATPRFSCTSTSGRRCPLATARSTTASGSSWRTHAGFRTPIVRARGTTSSPMSRVWSNGTCGSHRQPARWPTPRWSRRCRGRSAGWRRGRNSS